MHTKTNSDLEQNTITFEDAQKLVNEIDRLNRRFSDYSTSVDQKLDAVENSMLELEAENARLVFAKAAAFAERDTCVALIAQLSAANGLRVGTLPDNRVIVDLPSGQVSWEFNDSEGHLFLSHPGYSDPLEDMTIEEKYRRVMNPGLSLSGD
jgi:hypothetical protein